MWAEVEYPPGTRAWPSDAPRMGVIGEVLKCVRT